MEDQLKLILDQAKSDIKASAPENYEELRIKYLGRKSELTKLMATVKDMPTQQRASAGKVSNQVKKEISSLLAELKAKVVEAPKVTLDPTLPALAVEFGRLHPITQMTERLTRLFLSLGFSVASGPELETEEFNFNLLNIPDEHPARDEWDTFWIERKKDPNISYLMRTHTSPVQLRYMREHTPPIKVIAPGRTYRYEAEDATHSSVFHQLEGLYIDRNVNVGHLKQILLQVFQSVLGSDVKLRFRPSYFPFTEPSFEVDVWYRNEWLEMGGAGMVHPKVLENGNIDPNTFTGFAFGLGIDRLVMIKHNIPDVRFLYSGNLNFLKQF